MDNLNNRFFLALTIFLFIQACNYNSSKNNTNELKDTIKSALFVPDTTAEMIPDSLITEEMLESSVVPLVELGREFKTDENFKEFVILKIKNQSKKKITNLMTIEGTFVGFNTNDFDENEGTAKNHRLNLNPGRTMSLRVKIKDERFLGWGIKFKKIRFSDGDTYSF